MTLRSRLIRLAHEKPELREHLLPLLKVGKEAADKKAYPPELRDISRVEQHGNKLTAIGRAMQTLGRQLEQKAKQLHGAHRALEPWRAAGQYTSALRSIVNEMGYESRGVEHWVSQLEREVESHST
jgi:hypothetical protein